MKQLNTAWMKAMGLLDEKFNRNFFTTIVIVLLITNTTTLYILYNKISYYEEQSEGHEIEKREIMTQCNSDKMQLIDKYETKIDTILNKFYGK